MTPERAIEILNPEHREHYDDIEVVNEACRMGIAAIKRFIPKKPNINKFPPYYANCPTCKKIVHEFWKDTFCLNCGQALDWSDM